MIDGVTGPGAFFGFTLGCDGELARWDRLVEYYLRLESESDRIKVVEMGETTEGNPFLLVIISSPGNLARLDEIREESLRLSDPRGLTEDEAETLIEHGKAVICQSMSLHASEVAPTQMAPELAFELVTGEDPDTLRILDNVVFLMVPCFNPDGQIMVTDWYRERRGTEYDGCQLPWLYHRYGGHDNNRDAFQVNHKESGYVASILFRDWAPQAYVDHHQMGSFGARFYIPPYTEPWRPYADPLVYWEHMWYGGHMATLLEQQGKAGVIAGGSTFPMWGHMGWHRITNHHNICGMLTETASVKLASPIHVLPEQLKGNHFSFPEYVAQTNFPNPWKGGWWRLREMVEQIKVSAWATLDHAARNRETVLRNMYLKAQRQTQRGSEDSEKAYIIPRSQHDGGTATVLVEKLLVQGIEIREALSGFTVGGCNYEAGSYIVSLAQPKYGVAKNLLGRTFYPDNAWTREKDGTPRAPRDKATDTMNEFMGVDVVPAYTEVDVRFKLVKEIESPSLEFVGGVSGLYALDCRENRSYKAVIALLDAGVRVWRSPEPIICGEETLCAGAWVVEASREELREYVPGIGGVYYPVRDSSSLMEVRKPRIGLYQRYYGGNADEGWTRLVLEQHGFGYETIRDKDIDDGLHENYDVIILPDDPAWMILGDKIDEKYMARGQPAPVTPPEYRSRMSKEGAENLKRFVSAGGTLVCLNESSLFAVEEFELSIRNSVEGLSVREFFCPASTLHVDVDTSDPLGYGMKPDSLLFFWDSPVLETTPSMDSENTKVAARYPMHQVLRSGWLDGEKYLAGKPALTRVYIGEGNVVMYGFRPQHRAQTLGTYKMLFNSFFL